MRGREFLHATGRGMEAQLKFVKEKGAADWNGKFAIDHKMFRGDALKLELELDEVERGEKEASIVCSTQSMPNFSAWTMNESASVVI